MVYWRQAYQLRMTCISYIVLTGRQTELRGREGDALDVENVGGEGGNRSTYTPGRSPGQGTGSGGRGGERGGAPDPNPNIGISQGKGLY